jgi:excinuclease ABC subunit A
MEMIAGSDWIIDIRPDAGDEGGKVVASGSPEQIATKRESRTAIYLARALGLGA